ncbi:MAG: carbon-phosphorus lyase complex subunit PhnI [Aestuariivirgaceae bacterium]|nr:carbon-phosphorus lyase complex subunit PhnI [Aestuariivirgaceae bacterium]
MYVAVKGGEKAIDAAHELLAERRRGNREVPEITTAQIDEQLALAVDRVMAEGSLYDRELASLAIKQARGDLIEAIFLVRAARTTLARFGASEPVDMGRMQIARRVSAAFKDIPGGQILGPTFDYTHRLLDPALAAQGDEVNGALADSPLIQDVPRVLEMLGDEGLIEPAQRGAQIPGDITEEPMDFPTTRDRRLQALARGDEGFLLSLAYSTQRGYGRTHPFVGEIRFGEVPITLVLEELGFEIDIGTIAFTECEMINQFHGDGEVAPQFTRGYGLVFGQLERKAMSMALVDRALRADEFGEPRTAPAQDEEFVISHADNVQATGFVEHLKLPHYVDFQSELGLLRTLRAEKTP